MFIKTIGILLSLTFLLFVQPAAHAQSSYYVRVPVPGESGGESWQPPTGEMYYDGNYINTYGPEGNVYAPNGRLSARKGEPFSFNATQYLVISGYEVTHMGFSINTSMDEGLFYRNRRKTSPFMAEI